MLRRAADAGRTWAHEALELSSPIYCVAAGGFTEDFIDAARADGRTVICWSLDDLYAA